MSITHNFWLVFRSVRFFFSFYSLRWEICFNIGPGRLKKKKTCRGYKDLVSLSRRRRRSSRPGIPKNGVKIKRGEENKRKKDFPNSPWKTAGPWHNTKTSVFQHCRLSLVVTIPYIYPTYTHIHENPFTVSLSLSDCACVFSSKNLRPPSLTMTPAILRPLFF